MAIELFAREGYPNVTMAMVADAAGVGLRTVARYFPQKEDLLLAVPREKQLRIREAMPSLAETADPLTGMIEQFHRLAERHAADIPRFNAWTRAIGTAPELWGKAIGENMMALERELAWYVADALGVDPDDDVRPVALAAALLAAIDAMDRFKAGWEKREDVHELLDVVINSLRSDFARLHRQRGREAPE